MKDKIITAEGHRIAISNPDKILFPEDGIRKLELVEYYAWVWPHISTFLQGRPVSLQRFPDGIHGEGFFQKETPAYFPDYIGRVKVKDKEGGTLYSVINNKASLIYIANTASIPIHTWQSREEKLRYPDQVIWDLDPSEEGFEKVRIGARLLRYMLEELGLKPLVKTTGSKGLHLCVPLKTDYTYEQVKAFSRQVAEFVSAKLPEIFTTELRKSKRHGRIFVDFLRNQYGHTAAAPYTVRALPGAPVGVPIYWDELEEDEVHPQFVNIRNIQQRIESVGGEIWKDFYRHPQSLDEPMKKLAKILSKRGAGAPKQTSRKASR